MNRTVARIVEGTPVMEGEGVLVHRPFPSAQGLRDFDPFLLLDEMGPLELPANAAKGFPDHPHRGFETVTMSFIVNRPKVEPVIRMTRVEVDGRSIRYGHEVMR